MKKATRAWMIATIPLGLFLISLEAFTLAFLIVNIIADNTFLAAMWAMSSICLAVCAIVFLTKPDVKK